MNKRKVYVCRKCTRMCRLEFGENLFGNVPYACPFGWETPEWREVSE